MKLDRNITKPRRGKYALIKLRVAQPTDWSGGDISQVKTAAIDFGDTEDTDFFVIRLKDKYAGPALAAYAEAARKDDPEYAAEVYDLAIKARNHPHQRQPD